MPEQRLLITTADFRKVYEGVRSEQWCYLCYRNMKAAYNLNSKRHFPTLKLFCEYMMLEESFVKQRLGW